MSEQRRFWRDCTDAQACLNFAARIGNKYQIRLTRSMSSLCIPGEFREKIFEESEVTHCQCHMVYLVGKFSLSLCLLYDQGVIMWGTKIEVNI